MTRISTARKAFVVRSGVALAHVHTLAEAAELMQALQPQWRRAISAAHAVPRPSDILGRVGDSASYILDELVRTFSLTGKASRTLGTALRVKEVRESLASYTDLLDDLKHMAAAADAERHLSSAVIERATRHVQDLDSDFHTCTDAASSVDGEISSDFSLPICFILLQTQVCCIPHMFSRSVLTMTVDLSNRVICFHIFTAQSR